VKLLLIRHAESVGNAERRLQGQGDFPLSHRGILQAERLAQFLAADELPTALYTSPLLRTKQTADRISAICSCPVQLLPQVREYDFGEASGLTWTEIADRYPDLIAAVRARTPDYPKYPGEEGREHFRARVCDAVLSVVAENASVDRVAIVTHAGPIVVTCLEVLGLPYQRPAAFAVENCSITTIEYSEKEPVLLATNDTCHLRGMA
jgi:broad specificity phosphatase PhoE